MIPNVFGGSNDTKRFGVYERTRPTRRASRTQWNISPTCSTTWCVMIVGAVSVTCLSCSTSCSFTSLDMRICLQVSPTNTKSCSKRGRLFCYLTWYFGALPCTASFQKQTRFYRCSHCDWCSASMHTLHRCYTNCCVRSALESRRTTGMIASRRWSIYFINCSIALWFGIATGIRVSYHTSRFASSPMCICGHAISSFYVAYSTKTRSLSTGDTTLEVTRSSCWPSANRTMMR